jgi:hypothetical protein
VLLEALECRVPVIGSKVDGSREALLDRQLGYLVNPDVREELVEAITHALTIVPSRKPNGLAAYFDIAHFRSRLAEWWTAQTERPKPLQGHALECLSACIAVFSFKCVGRGSRDGFRSQET